MSDDRIVAPKNTSGRLQGDIAGCRAVAAELNCSAVWAAKLIRRTLEKVARETMVAANGTEPTKRQVEKLAASDEFQNLVIQILKEKGSEARIS